MYGKSWLRAGSLLFVVLSMASAKTWSVTLGEPVKAGSVDLKAGEYKVKVEGSQAVFSDVLNSTKSWTVPVAVQNSDTKFSETKVQSQAEGGVNSLREIDLGGSTTRLQFGQ